MVQVFRNCPGFCERGRFSCKCHFGIALLWGSKNTPGLPLRETWSSADLKDPPPVLSLHTHASTCTSTPTLPHLPFQHRHCFTCRSTLDHLHLFFQTRTAPLTTQRPPVSTCFTTLMLIHIFLHTRTPPPISLYQYCSTCPLQTHIPLSIPQHPCRSSSCLSTLHASLHTSLPLSTTAFLSWQQPAKTENG